MFIDEWYGTAFYKTLPIGYHSSYCFGQVFWTNAHYSMEHFHLWRPVIDPNEPTKTIANTFRMVDVQADAFKRATPLHAPKLETDEEFIEVRAKRRPVILVQTEAPIADIRNFGFRGKFSRRRVMVAQVFSIADKVTGTMKYDPRLIERVRRMEFPQLLFLPASGTLTVDSLLRLDEIQSVWVPHLDARDLCLGDDVQQLLKSQIQFLLTGEGSDYVALREMLMND